MRPREHLYYCEGGVGIGRRAEEDRTVFSLT